MAKLSRNKWGLSTAVSLFLIVLVSILISRNLQRPPTRMSATVRGLSMSPTYRCSRFEIECADCSSVFNVAAELSTGERLEYLQFDCICPWCGADCRATKAKFMPGEVVDIHPIVDVNDIRRFDVVAFKRRDAVRIKRVIGLPGERIEIDGGDIIIDGERLRKTFQQFMDTAIVVADSRYCLDGFPWIGESGWRFSHGTWHSPSGANQSKLVCTPAAVIPGQSHASRRIMNYNAFDPHTPRSLCDVGDFMVSFVVNVQQLRQAEIAMHDGWQEWRCVVSRIADSRPAPRFSLQLRSDMGADSNSEFMSEFMVEPPDESVEMHFGCVDQRIAVKVAGSDVFSIPFHSSSSTRVAVPQPVWIRSASGSATIYRLIVRRDLHYVPNAIDEVPTATAWQLQDGQYFVLGDYSPVSIDSRSLKIGAVVESEIVGTVSQRR